MSRASTSFVVAKTWMAVTSTAMTLVVVRRERNMHYGTFRSNFAAVMRGLVPRIHVFGAAAKAWMAGTSPAMTV